MVAGQVLGRMKQLMVDNNTAASHSFLLDDDSSIPFSLDDIQNLMDEKVRLPSSHVATLACAVLADTMPMQSFYITLCDPLVECDFERLRPCISFLHWQCRFRAVAGALLCPVVAVSLFVSLKTMPGCSLRLSCNCAAAGDVQRGAGAQEPGRRQVV